MCDQNEMIRANSFGEWHYAHETVSDDSQLYFKINWLDILLFESFTNISSANALKDHSFQELFTGK